MTMTMYMTVNDYVHLIIHKSLFIFNVQLKIYWNLQKNWYDASHFLWFVWVIWHMSFGDNITSFLSSKKMFIIIMTWLNCCKAF